MVFGLERTKAKGDTDTNTGPYGGLARVGKTGDSYCLSPAMVAEKGGKITANNAELEAGKTGVDARGDGGAACTVTAAMSGTETERLGVSAKLSMGQFYGIVAYGTKNVTGNGTETENEYLQVWGGVHLADSTSALIGYGQSETEGSDANPNAVTLGLYHSMGGGLQLFYEGISRDPDAAGMDSSANHKAGIRFDF